MFPFPVAVNHYWRAKPEVHVPAGNNRANIFEKTAYAPHIRFYRNWNNRSPTTPGEFHPNRVESGQIKAGTAGALRENNN